MLALDDSLAMRTPFPNKQHLKQMHLIIGLREFFGFLKADKGTVTLELSDY
jgi:hypothetical protein